VESAGVYLEYTVLDHTVGPGLENAEYHTSVPVVAGCRGILGCKLLLVLVALMDAVKQTRQSENGV
jgi:hypothetical protein